MTFSVNGYSKADRRFRGVILRRNRIKNAHILRKRSLLCGFSIRIPLSNIYRWPENINVALEFNFFGM